MKRPFGRGPITPGRGRKRSPWLLTTDHLRYLGWSSKHGENHLDRWQKEILSQLTSWAYGSFVPFWRQGFTHPRCCRISSIKSSYPPQNQKRTCLKQPWLEEPRVLLWVCQVYIVKQIDWNQWLAPFIIFENIATLRKQSLNRLPPVDSVSME